MIRSNLDSPPRRTERTNVHRQRHQKGSLQVRQHGKRKMWVLLYRDGSTRKYATLGLYSKISKSQAEEKRDELLNEVWGYQNYPCTRTVDNHILRLRQKLECAPSNPSHFLTMFGLGYKFVP